MDGRLVVVIVFLALDDGKFGAMFFLGPFEVFPTPPIGIQPMGGGTEVEPAKTYTAQMIGPVEIGLGKEGKGGDDDGAVADVLGFYRQDEHQQNGGLGLQQAKHDNQCQQTGQHSRARGAERGHAAKKQTCDGAAQGGDDVKL